KPRSRVGRIRRAGVPPLTWRATGRARGDAAGLKAPPDSDSSRSSLLPPRLRLPAGAFCGRMRMLVILRAHPPVPSLELAPAGGRPARRIPFLPLRAGARPRVLRPRQPPPAARAAAAGRVRAGAGGRHDDGDPRTRAVCDALALPARGIRRALRGARP